MAVRDNGIGPERRDEDEYFREMDAAYLKPFLAGLAAELALLGKDASTSAWIATISNYVSRFARDQAFNFPRDRVERWAARYNERHARKFIRQFWRRARVDVGPAIRGVGEDALRQAIEDSISLIKTIPDRFHAQMTDALLAGERETPLDLRARSDIFSSTGRSSGYNLRRITRDQSNKLTGKLNEMRQTEVGVRRYSWETSADDRVRPTHASKDRRIFSWNAPPPDTGHPGNDIQCRCVAIPDISVQELHSIFGRQ